MWSNADPYRASPSEDLSARRVDAAREGDNLIEAMRAVCNEDERDVIYVTCVTRGARHCGKYR